MVRAIPPGMLHACRCFVGVRPARSWQTRAKRIEMIKNLEKSRFFMLRFCQQASSGSAVAPGSVRGDAVDARAISLWLYSTRVMLRSEAAPIILLCKISSALRPLSRI